jgi:hypothetical protein
VIGRLPICSCSRRPGLVVEIASKGTGKRDETVKASVRAQRAFPSPLELAPEAADVLSTPLLPGLDLPLVGIVKE